MTRYEEDKDESSPRTWSSPLTNLSHLSSSSRSPLSSSTVMRETAALATVRSGCAGVEEGPPAKEPPPAYGGG